MKAIISQLWETGIDIITTENDSNEISSFADLKKCENILVGDKDEDIPSDMPDVRQVMINNNLIYVSFDTVTHPTGFGKLRVCEVYCN